MPPRLGLPTSRRSVHALHAILVGRASIPAVPDEACLDERRREGVFLPSVTADSDAGLAPDLSFRRTLIAIVQRVAMRVFRALDDDPLHLRVTVDEGPVIRPVLAVPAANDLGRTGVDPCQVRELASAGVSVARPRPAAGVPPLHESPLRPVW